MWGTDTAGGVGRNPYSSTRDFRLGLLGSIPQTSRQTPGLDDVEARQPRAGRRSLTRRIAEVSGRTNVRAPARPMQERGLRPPTRSDSRKSRRHNGSLGELTLRGK
jgi:hypothetical protein